VPRKTGLTAEAKKEAVLKLLRHEEPAAKIARRYRISEQTLYRYRDAFLAAGEQGLQGGAPGKAEREQVEELKRQLAERDQVIGELTVANRILKKTADR
jgi:transposase-like protein